MNILIPDSWLREFLITKATPDQIKEYLSLCGPSVEHVNMESGEIVYDIEVTGNRPDSMSIFGIAREAATILPRFGIAAKLVNDPYQQRLKTQDVRRKISKKLTIETNSILNPRWTSVVIDNVKVGPSPEWLKKRLETTQIRSLNTIVDITNYIMRAYGQPVHAFDYDQVLPKNGVPTMILRASRKGERLITLDGKSHTLPGDDIVIEDGSGRLIDLCGIMGAHNSSIRTSTKTVVLFMQTYDPSHIRKTSMSLAHRTEAAGLFEKGLDPELVMPAIFKGIELIAQVAGGTIASKIYDIYPKPYKPYTVSVTKEKLTTYLGTTLPDKSITNILTPLGFKATLSKSIVSVRVPSFRRDITIYVDIIEEIARIYGYHNIKSKLPSTEPPVVIPDPTLSWEEEIKIRLRDWGYTEIYTYSMISEELMDIFGLDKQKAYKISNPLSNEWVFMRPHLFPSVLQAMKQNLNVTTDMKIFELSMNYQYRSNELPLEVPTLIVAWTGEAFYEAKGLAETIFSLFGIAFPVFTDNPLLSSDKKNVGLNIYNHNQYLSLGDYGSLGVINDEILSKMGIRTPVTRLYLDFAKLVADAQPTNKYTPIPKFPASYEDIALIVPPNTYISPIIDALKKIDPLVANVTLLDSYGDTRTLHVTYLSAEKNLTAEDIHPVREKILHTAEKKFNAQLKTA